MGLPFAQAFLRNMNDGAFVINRERRIILWNKAAEQLTGLKEKDIIGKQCHKTLMCELCHPMTHVCSDACPLMGVLKSGQAKVLESVAVSNRMNQQKLVQMRAMPFTNHQGLLEGVIVLMSEHAQPTPAQVNDPTHLKAAFIDKPSGLVNRHFLTHQYDLAIRHTIEQPMGMVLIEIDEATNPLDLIEAARRYERLNVLSNHLAHLSADHVDLLAGRWSEHCFIVLAYNCHEVFLEWLVETLQHQLVRSMQGEYGKRFSLNYRMSATLVQIYEPLEKVVEILKKQHRYGFDAKDPSNESYLLY